MLKLNRMHFLLIELPKLTLNRNYLIFMRSCNSILQFLEFKLELPEDLSRFTLELYFSLKDRLDIIAAASSC